MSKALTELIRDANRHITPADRHAILDLIEQQAARIAELEAQIATVAPAVDAQPVAWRHKATKILRNDSIAKGADFEPADWEPLYTAAQSEGLRKDAEPVDERAAFEHWCKTHCGLCDRDLHQTISGAYRSGYVDDMWDGWNGRAALSQHKGEKDD